MGRATLLQAQRDRVGKNVSRARKRKGFSHDALAAIVGSSRQHLIKIEKGLHLPGDGLLQRIAEATDSTVDALTSQTDDEDEESDAVVDLVHAIRRLVRAEVRA